MSDFDVSEHPVLGTRRFDNPEARRGLLESGRRILDRGEGSDEMLYDVRNMVAQLEAVEASEAGGAVREAQMRARGEEWASKPPSERVRAARAFVAGLFADDASQARRAARVCWVLTWPEYGGLRPRGDGAVTDDDVMLLAAASDDFLAEVDAQWEAGEAWRGPAALIHELEDDDD